MEVGWILSLAGWSLMGTTGMTRKVRKSEFSSTCLSHPFPHYIALASCRRHSFSDSEDTNWNCSLCLWLHYLFPRISHFVYLVDVQSLSCVQLFATPWTAAHQTCRSFTISRSLLKLMSIESVMPSNHLVLCHPFGSSLSC